MLNNIHYYNGWKINRRVIISLRTYETYLGGRMELYIGHAIAELSDIEKALNYLDNGETGEVDIESRMKEAAESHNLRNIRLKYFTVTLY